MEQVPRILRLEDDLADRDLIRARLDEGGLACRITCVRTAEEFEAALRQGAFDLILADYRLPAYDGMAALRLARQLCPDLPFLFVSGTMGEDAAVEGLTAGATDFVLKQRLSRLVPAMRRALHEAESRRERKRAEDALRESEERYRSLFQRASDGILLASADGTLVSVNESFARMHGYCAEEMLHMRLEELNAPETSQLAPARMRRLLGGEALTFEVSHYHKDGHMVPIEVSASLVCVAGQSFIQSFHRDITERKRAEEALRQSEERYQRITEAITDYIYTVRVSDGRATDTTHGPGCLAVTGYRASEFAEDPLLWFHMVVAEDGPKVVEQARRILAGEDPPPIEHRIVHKNGTVRWVRNTFVPHRDEYGALVTYDGLIQDITGRRRAEEEKTALENKLQQAQKMESVGRLAGGVAHDFNNMLGVILGHAEIALERLDTAGPTHADLVAISKAANRSADLTRQLLAFARRQLVAPRVLDLNDTVVGMLKMLQRLIGEGIRLNWQPEADLWPVKLDPSQIDQILANLCVNARDAIAGVGAITIATGNDVFDETACADLPGVAPGEYVRLVVSDDGCGMDEETLAHIFEPFFTTKAVGEGTGLGLATVYGAVKQNRGFVGVCSRPGAGTTFTIHLPRYVGTVEEARTGCAAGPLMRGHETILLVEDEPGILRLATMMLGQQGYTVLAAGAPGEAIRLASQHAGPIHLLMTDVIMPEMDGRALAKHLLAGRPTLKCLFMSGYPADVMVHGHVLDEGVSFLQKPFSMRDLAARVRATLDGDRG